MLDMAGVTPVGRLLARAIGETGRVARGILATAPGELVRRRVCGPCGLGDPSGQRHFGHFDDKSVRWFPLYLANTISSNWIAIPGYLSIVSTQEGQVILQASNSRLCHRWILPSSVWQKFILAPVWLPLQFWPSEKRFWLDSMQQIIWRHFLGKSSVKVRSLLFRDSVRERLWMHCRATEILG